MVNRCWNATGIFNKQESHLNQKNIDSLSFNKIKVFKYSNGERVLTLGESLVPGNDQTHFCKPTDVIISNDGSNIYVADGYCNSRIVKFDSKGNYLKEYSMPEDEEPLRIPHSIILIETLDLVCVADRENGR